MVASYDPANFWCSAAGDKTPWVVVDLNEPVRIAAVSVQFRPVAGSNGLYYNRFVPTWVTVEVSLDGQGFTLAVQSSRDVPVAGQMYKHWFSRHPVYHEGRHVKLNFGLSQETATPFTGCVQLAEIRIHAEQ